MVDPKKHRILDILPDRTQPYLSDYFRSIERSHRHRVKFFVSDMWQPYVDLAKAYFPNAAIIINKYLFIRQITWAIENVRNRLQKIMPASLRKYYKRSRKLILTRYCKLKDENNKQCDLMLLYNDDKESLIILRNGSMTFASPANIPNSAKLLQMDKMRRILWYKRIRMLCKNLQTLVRRDIECF